MKQFITFLKKEFYHIARDRRTLLVLFGIPIAQIILFGFALSNEVKNTKVGVFDQSKDEQSILLTEQIKNSEFFDFVSSMKNIAEVDQSLRSGETKMVIVIPSQFSENLNHENKAQIQLITDGTNPNMASTLVNFASSIIRGFQNSSHTATSLPYQVDVVTRMMYNPQLKGEYTFVPGVIALVLMLVCAMMTSVSIVKEKEMGNMEVLLVSPVNPLSLTKSSNEL